jgi:hypothetical protein
MRGKGREIDTLILDKKYKIIFIYNMTQVLLNLLITILITKILMDFVHTVFQTSVMLARRNKISVDENTFNKIAEILEKNKK